MDISQTLDVLSALNSETRLRLAIILRDTSLSTKELQEEYNSRFNADLRRESIYRALEKLRNAEILERYYDEEGNNFVYSLTNEQIVIDINNL